MKISIDVVLRHKLDAARDQGLRPTCVAFATSAAHECKRGTAEYLSTEHLFYCGAQRSHKDPAQGLTPMAVREALLQDGQTLDSVWPYASVSPAVAAWRPPPGAHATHKAKMELMTCTVAQVRDLIRAGRAVVLFIIMTNALYTPDPHGAVRVVAGDKPIVGHALLAVGSGHALDGEYLLVRNSWGTSWGLAGHAWLHDQYLANQLVVTGTI